MTFDDWYLPSKDGLEAMYTNLYMHGVGNFLPDRYWSSTEWDTTQAWYHSFLFGNAGVDHKINMFYVRACRSFTESIGVYDLRDIGPAGGLIFYVDGPTYYEAAPEDMIEPVIWCNVLSFVDITGPYVRDGQANTNAIIGVEGHTGSAAYVCDQYVIIYTPPTTVIPTTVIPTTTTIPTTTIAPRRGVTISHNSPLRVTSIGLIPYVVFCVSPGLGGCYEFIDMFIRSSFKPDSVLVSVNEAFTDYAEVVSDKIIEYNTGWYHIKRLPRTVMNRVLQGKMLFVKINFANNLLFYDLRLVSTGYKEVTGF